MTFLSNIVSECSVGLDLSESAVKAAQERASSMHLSEVKFIAGNFFEFEGRFDIIYDYTFLCALPHHYRKPWAQKMSELLSEEGELITLIFPICPGMEGGPPYELSVDIMKELLLPFFDLTHLEAPKESFKGREGQEMVGRWKLKK